MLPSLEFTSFINMTNTLLLDRIRDAQWSEVETSTNATGEVKQL